MSGDWAYVGEHIAVTRQRDFDARFQMQELRWAMEDEAYFAAREAKRQAQEDRVAQIQTGRCDDCGYTLGSTGHIIACAEQVAA